MSTTTIKSRPRRSTLCAFCRQRLSTRDGCETCGAPLELVEQPGPIKSPRITLRHNRGTRFGLCGSPRPGDSQIRLTYSRDGATNNTRIQLGQRTPLLEQLNEVVPLGIKRDALVGVWESGQLRVAQRVTLVAGPTTQAPDTLRVDYLVWNRGRRKRKNLGLRAMVDTLIGSNDGVPFIVAGRQGVLEVSADWLDPVPSYVQAIERPDPIDPGAIVHITLRGGDATPPDRFVIDHWPGSSGRYDFYQGPGISWGRDSAVGLFWDFELAAGEAKRFTYLYGLGGMSSLESGNARLSLTVPKKLSTGDAAFLAGRVFGAAPGRRARLELPAGLSCPEDPLEIELDSDESASFAFVGWEVVADAPGTYDLRVVLVGDQGVEEAEEIVEIEVE